MAENIYFIKTNPVIAKINLYNTLCNKEIDILNFLNDDKKTCLEIIKNKVKKSIESFTKEEFLMLISWFNNEYRTDSEEVKIQLFINGIEIFYHIPTLVDVKSFHKILLDYERYSKKKLSFIVDSQHFNEFLIYGIFYTGMHQNDKNFLRYYLKSDYRNLYSFAEIQFNNNGNSLENSNEIYNYFIDLYDLTKHYKGSIIKLYDNVNT